ncbi:MAG: RHS repeat protein [Candidatus Atribacteria bacterium]|nr:MAG: RHS repeat protein [Candidatus Atribacteria bacterium]
MKINYYLPSCIVLFILFFSYSIVMAMPNSLYRCNELPAAAAPGLRSPAHVGDPITIYTGTNYQAQKDLVFPTPHLRGFVFKRSYNSQTHQMGPLGYGWTHSYEVHLQPSFIFERRTYLQIIDETGRGVYFDQAGNGHYAGAFKEKSFVKLENGNFVWHRIDGSRFIFNQEHLLIQIDDRVSNRQYLSYDKGNRLTAIADSTINYILNFHYYQQGRLHYISGKGSEDHSNLVWVTYDYDEKGNLISATYPDASGFNYAYTDPNDVHNLTEKRDKTGKFFSSWSYDNQDRAIKNKTHDSKGVSIEYVNENEVRVTDAKGITRIYTIWDIDGRKVVTSISAAPGHQMSPDEIRGISYDSKKRVIEVRYVGELVTQFFDFDSRGNAQTWKYLKVTQVQKIVKIEVQKIVKYVYHPKISVKLSQTELTKDGKPKKVIVWDYDTDGNEIPNENPMGKPMQRIEMSMQEDDSGKLVPYKNVTKFKYDEYGRLTSVDPFGLSDDSDPRILRYDYFTIDILTGGLSAGI